eukprot:c38814_g1_i1 orf=233-847(-)
MGGPNDGDMQIAVEPNVTPHNCVAEEHATKVWKIVGVLLRAAAIVLCIVALCLLARDKQIVFQNIAGISIKVSAKHSYVKAFVYLIYANGLAAIYCFLTVLATAFNLIPTSSRLPSWILFLSDQAVTYVLLAAAAASSEVAFIAKRGEDKVSWNEVCSVFGHFCNVVAGSLVTTFLSVLLFATLSAMSAHNLFRRYGSAVCSKS